MGQLVGQVVEWIPSLRNKGMSVYLVTGGGGFIGSHLVRTLVQRNIRVRVLDNSSTGSRRRIADVLPDVEWVDGDVRDRDVVRKVCRDVDIIFHHAAVASVPRSIIEPELTHACNVTGTLHILLAARDAGVRRVVLASSSAVYGNTSETLKSETTPMQPISPYGAQKLAAEMYCRVWQASHGLETVVLRYFNVFGPGQNSQSEYAAVIPRFITAVIKGQTPIIYGDGEQSRDFMYISDVVDVTLLAATAPGAAGRVMNVGSGTKVTLNQLLAHLGQMVGRALYPVYESARPGDVRESLADISLLRSVLGYEPLCSFSRGLALTFQAFEAASLVAQQPLTGP